MPSPDPIAALVAFLKTTALDDTTGGRIFGAELPRGVSQEMPTTAIVLTPSGGGAIGGAFQNYGDARFDFRCYAATPHAAHDLWLALLPALKQMHRVVFAECLLHWARRGGGPIALRDPDTDWPFVFSSWQVLVSEVAAA